MIRIVQFDFDSTQNLEISSRCLLLYWFGKTKHNLGFSEWVQCAPESKKPNWSIFCRKPTSRALRIRWLNFILIGFLQTWNNREKCHKESLKNFKTNLLCDYFTYTECRLLWSHLDIMFIEDYYLKIATYCYHLVNFITFNPV